MILITATTRLARELRREYDEEQVAAGRSSWPAAHILPLSAWLSELWDEWLYSGPAERPPQLLRPSEEGVIWEDIVRGSKQGNELLQVTATADAALDAWKLACEWKLPMDAPEWNDSTDSEAFHQWAQEFSRRCKENDWLSGATLLEFVADRIDNGTIPVPERIEMAGFLEWTPVQERLFGSLQRRGVEVEERELASNTAANALRLGLIDHDTEIRTVAQWARHSLESATEVDASVCRIGIVVPDLAAYRSRIERIFADEFHPNCRLRPDRDPERVFNISLGPALVEYPLIDAALLILRTDPQEMSLEDAGRLLRSPFIQSGREEVTRGPLLDAALRRGREQHVSVAHIITMAREETAPHRCPELGARLERWKDMRDTLPERQMPSDWAASLSRLLEAVGWPGEESPNSVQYQTMVAWNELLSELGGLDNARGPTTLAGAVGALHRLAASRQFQPESEPAPIQILGVFEASGLRFDHLWIMGMHDGAWPASTSPNPFLPFRLQDRFNLPRSSPRRELEFTKLLTERLLASAPRAIVSYPEREGDSELRLSPLLTALPEMPADWPGLQSSTRYVERLRQSAQMEVLEDHDGPPWDGVQMRGGTAVFRRQAACPFRAFSELRLAADALEGAQPGWSALDRGLLVHDVLDRVWGELRSHERLLSFGAERLERLVRATVAAAIHDMSVRRRVLRQPRFAAIEQARLERIVSEWLAIEKDRRPFAVLHQEEKRRVTVGGIDVRIRADRVDRLRDGNLVIVDYKTGDHSPAEWEGDRPDAPQLPLYAATAESEVSGVFFGNLKTGKSRFRGVATSEGVVPGVKPSDSGLPLEEMIENWRAVLDRLGEEFREGQAVVDPKKPNETCRYCPLPTLCRISETRTGPDDSGSEDVDG